MDARFNRFNSYGFAANPALNANLGNPFQIGGGAAGNLGNPFQIGGGAAGGGNGADTTLRLDSSGLSTTPTGSKRKWGLMHKSVRRIESSLSLGLGHSSTSSDSKGSSATACTSASSAKEVESSSMDVELDFSLHLGSEKIPIPWKSGRPESKGAEVWPKVDLELSLSSCAAESDVTAIQLSPTPQQSSLKSVGQTFNYEDRTVSPSSVMGSFYHHFPTPDRIQTGFCLNKPTVEMNPSSATAPELSASIITTPKSSVTCSSGLTHQLQRSNNTKQCQFYGCGKGARGASGLCIAHGGGRRCQRPGCLKGAEGRTAFCKAHGGGRRCEFLGCTKSAEGKTDLCIAHGGGRRCSNEGCNRAARGNLGCAFGMVVVKDARGKTAQRVQKAFQVSAFHMVVVGDVSTLSAVKELREAPCSAKLMVVGKGAPTRGVLRVLKVVLLTARDTVEGKGVLFMEVVNVLKVFMVVPSTVWHMVVGRGVLFQSVLRVRGEGRITVSAMVGERGANQLDVGRVRREALISARLMVVGRGARGATLLLNLVSVKISATPLLEGSLGCVLPTVLWINVFMAVKQQLGLSFMIQNLK